MFSDQDYVQIQQDCGEQTAPAQNENYGDFIIRYMQNVQDLSDFIGGSCFLPVNEVFGVGYIPLEEVGSIEINSYSYNTIPKCYVCMDMESISASGVSRLHDHPYLQLRGSGTAVAVIDTGIDYRNPLFMRPGGGTRIVYLWDQTLEGTDNRVPYGRLFTREEIDRALASEDPLGMVPSRDETGHGTALAGLAAGNILPAEDFAGAAPEAALIVVKLKQAKTYLKEFYLYPPDAEVYQENDIMLGIAWSVRFARELGMPLSVCLGLGSSQGAHVGSSPLSQYINYLSGFSQISVAAAAGNEGAAQHHFREILSGTQRTAAAELRIGEDEPGFAMEFWGQPPVNYGMKIQSPTGESLDVSSSLGTGTQTLSFIFVETKVQVNYIAIERQTGNTLIYLRFLNPAPGIWRISVSAQEENNTEFHMWLPVKGLISEDTYFLQPSPYNTVTAPADAREALSVSAYQYRDNSFYLQSGRGFSPDGAIIPQICAPGAGIRIPLLTGDFGSASGTSYAAAMTAGVAALLFEWAAVRGNQAFFTGINVRHYLERGARRDEDIQYPSREWGYGRLDLYHTFELLS